MKKSNKAVNDWIMGGMTVGMAAAVCRLRDEGWTPREIAGQWQVISKAAGNGAIIASGINGDPRTPEPLSDYMENQGRMMAESLIRQRDGAPATPVHGNPD